MDRPLKRLALWTQRWPVFILGLAWLGWVAITQLWPASWWLEVPMVRVQDGRAGQPIYLFVDRTIHRPFIARWAAVVRLQEHGRTEVACAADAMSDYRPDSALPAKVTLDWWTAGRCATLAPGRYALTTVWEIQGTALLPDKQVKAVSNLFEVTP